jgi:aminopeptidase N
MGLLGDAGNLPLRLAGQTPDPETSDNTHTVLTVDQPRHTFVFEGVTERPVPSLLRGFSAPVRLDYDYSRDALCALIRRDDDGFVRWDSAQALATRVIHEVEAKLASGAMPAVDPLLVNAYGDLLQDESLDPALVAEMMRLPSEDYLAELASQGDGANVDTIHQARDAVRCALGGALEQSLLARYQQLENPAPYSPDGEQIAARSLRNICLSYLVAANPAHMQLAQAQYRLASNMTDRLAALREIAFYGDTSLRNDTLEDFYREWHDEVLVVNQWLQLQAAIPDELGLTRVQALLDHPDFDSRNPNKVRALIGGFANQNPINFHREDGSGYRFLGDVIIRLNRQNPQLAARLVTPLTKWRNYVGRTQLMRAELQRLAAEPALSPDVFEVVTKSLTS